MFSSKFFGLLLLCGFALGSVVALPQASFAQGGGSRFRIEARPTGVKAKARFEQKNDRRKFNFQLELAIPGATGQVSVSTAAGTFDLGTFTVDALGRGIIDIDTTEGDTVPAMAVDDTVTLSYNGGSYSGTFRSR